MHQPVAATPQRSLDALATRRRRSTSAPSQEHSALIAEVLRDEAQPWWEHEETADAADIEERLLVHGFPVAFCAGDDLPDIPDSTGADEAAEVMDIRIGQLRRYLRDLPPMQRKVICLFWGLDRPRPCSLAEVAETLGLSQPSVNLLLVAGMDVLSERFGVPDDLAA